MLLLIMHSGAMLKTKKPLKKFDAPSLIKYIIELETNLEAVQTNYNLLKQDYDLLIYRRFARSAEKFLADNQLLLFTSEAEKNGPDKNPKQAEEFEVVKSHKRKKKGRKPINPNIPREQKILDIDESEKTCACGAKLVEIGRESSEKLHIVPPRLYVEETIRLKYACRNCEGTEDEGKPTVRIAPVKPSIIPRSIASPSLLSYIVVQKFEDHLPYYRQEKQFDRIGVTISRQDMSNWQQQAYEKIKPIFGLLKDELKSGPVIQMDETTVQVMGEKDRKDTQKSYMWLTRGGPLGKPVTIYEYRETRSGQHAKEILKGYSGYLQTDGYPGYDRAVEGNNSIIHAGCFAHSRRKFFEAAQATEYEATAGEGINFIKRLYAIENKLRNKYNREEERKKFNRIRQLCTWRVLNDFKEWLFVQKNTVLPSSLLGRAVDYTLAQWDKLVRYRDSPYLTPDNNACENAIRPFVLGRKNWLFSKSPEGADSSCGMYTLIQTAIRNGLEPYKYLTELFEKAPYASSHEDWINLLPWNIS